ncbi:MAG: TetR/AcrR family transcriptional regulator [Bacteroidales bacterium]
MESTKEHIMLVAFKLFAQKGYKDVSMSMLVKESGLSKGAFYHYFENKEQLFVESLDNLFFSYTPFNQSEDSKLKDSLKENVQDYIRNARNMIKKMKEQFSDVNLEQGYYRLMIDAVNYAPNFYKKVIESNEMELKFWKRIFKKAQDQGEIKADLDIELLAYQFQYVQDGIGLQGVFTGKMEKLYETFEKIFNQIYDIIKN